MLSLHDVANHGELASKYDEATDIRKETSGLAFQSKTQFDNCYHRLDKTKQKNLLTIWLLLN